MRYLHTMIRVANLDDALDFYCRKLGLLQQRRYDNEAGRFTLVYLAAPQDSDIAAQLSSPQLELTLNWDPEVYT